MPSWTFLETFSSPSRHSEVGWAFLSTFNAMSHRDAQASGWRTICAWTASLRTMVDDLTKAALAQLVYWHVAFELLGGDPAEHDWSGFRPLRTSREEDWSDWLQHLLATSKAGMFAKVLFEGILPADVDLRDTSVLREISSLDGERRADLMILWKGQVASHIEVKVGDLGFDKTYQTCRLLAKAFPEVKDWRHIILLPKADRFAWYECRDERGKEGPDVCDLAWDRVAIALRAALLAGGEPLSWQTWAWTFCGVIEQRLLMIPPLKPELRSSINRNRHDGQGLVDFLEILNCAKNAGTELCRNL